MKINFTLCFCCNMCHWLPMPGMLRFMGSQRVSHDWATELNWTDATEQKNLKTDTTISVHKKKDCLCPDCGIFQSVYLVECWVQVQGQELLYFNINSIITFRVDRPLSQLRLRWAAAARLEREDCNPFCCFLVQGPFRHFKTRKMVGYCQQSQSGLFKK